VFVTVFTTARLLSVSLALSTRNSYKEMKKITGHGVAWFENIPSPVYIRIFLWRENEAGFAGAKLRCLDVGSLYNRAELDCISCYHERRP
jgi:hypothetical protein